MGSKTDINSGILEYRELDQILTESTDYKKMCAEIDTFYGKEENKVISSVIQRKDYIERKLSYEQGEFLRLRPLSLTLICICVAMVVETATDTVVMRTIRDIFLLLGFLVPVIYIWMEDRNISVKLMKKDRSRQEYMTWQFQKAALEYELGKIRVVLG